MFLTSVDMHRFGFGLTPHSGVVIRHGNDERGWSSVTAGPGPVESSRMETKTG
jgi:hypothetical protein